MQGAPEEQERRTSLIRDTPQQGPGFVRRGRISHVKGMGTHRAYQRTEPGRHSGVE